MTVLFAVFSCAPHSAGPAKVLRDPQAYRRVAAILHRLIPLMDIVNRDRYAVLIVDDKEPNAYALEDFTIVVQSGLLPMLTDDELTCVMAHEIAHLSLGHVRQRRIASASRNRVFTEMKHEHSGGLLARMIKPFAVHAYSRNQETEADMETLRVMREIGMPAEIYVDVLTKLKHYDEENGSDGGGGLLDNHPSLDERIRKIKNAVVQ